MDNEEVDAQQKTPHETIEERDRNRVELASHMSGLGMQLSEMATAEGWKTISHYFRMASIHADMQRAVEERSRHPLHATGPAVSKRPQ